MKTKQCNRVMSRILSTATCLSLAIGLQAFAAPQLEQPGSIVNGIPQVATVALEQDVEVTPVGCTDSACCGDCNCNRCCEPVCCPTPVTTEVKKHCWKVKLENICIPGYRFECNWKKKCKNGCDCGDSCCSNGSCGKPTCGRVRCIKVLEKHEYTCEKCGYEWNVKCVGFGNGSCCGKGGRCGKGGCCCPSCGCAAVDSTESDVQLTSATKATAPVAAEEAEEKKPSLTSRFLPWLK